MSTYLKRPAVELVAGLSCALIISSCYDAQGMGAGPLNEPSGSAGGGRTVADGGAGATGAQFRRDASEINEGMDARIGSNDMSAAHAGNEKVDAGLALAPGLGLACTSNSACPVGVACMNPSAATVQPNCQPGSICNSFTVTRAGLGWSGGYCATDCTSDSSCGSTGTYSASCLFGLSGTTLTIIGGQTPTKCVVRCGPKNECPSGLVCSGGIACGDPAGSTLKFCLPCGPSTGAARAAGGAS